MIALGRLGRCISAAAALGIAGCNGVLGIEEREFVPEPEVPLCEKYCATVMEQCPGELAVYTSLDTCLGTCPHLPPGKLGDTEVDTVGCRLRQAEAAGQTDEPEVHCSQAGPGGRGVCGNKECKVYCELLPTICTEIEIPSDLSPEKCPATCDDLLASDLYAATKAHDEEFPRDCRVHHLTNATIDQATHCKHAVGNELCD